jgi:hypothetical protein
MSEDKEKKISLVRFFPPRVGEGNHGAPDFSAPIRVHTDGRDELIQPEGRRIDGWGRDTTDWINVGGKDRPHP